MPVDRLQWGHHFAVVDTSAGSERLSAYGRLQWGHHFAVVDTSAGSERLSAYGRLQWGHHFAVVDTKHDLVAVSAFATASMGPPLCSGGYGEVTYFACPQVESLQWGHHFAVVDTASTSATTWNRSTCFNGATTLQWWIQ